MCIEEKTKIENAEVVKFKREYKEKILKPIWISLHEIASNCNTEIKELKQMIKIHKPFLETWQKTETETGKILKSLMLKNETYLDCIIETMRCLENTEFGDVFLKE